MQSKNVALGLVALSFAGGLLWSSRSTLDRVRSIEERLEGVSAGIEPIHARCATLEAALEEANRALDSLEQGVGASRSDAERLSATFEEGSARLDRVQDELSRLQGDAEDRFVELGLDLERYQLELSERDGNLASLTERFSWVEDTLESIPTGVILSWLPGEGDIPDGWLLCDGSQGTPDLRGLFLRGVTRFDRAGRYHDSAKMQPAGTHSHATDINRSIYGLPRSTTKSPGDWLSLFDAGIKGSDPETLSDHGYHVHADQHLPAHFTVIYIMKSSRS